jgi:2Fe-2S ferredoxin
MISIKVEDKAGDIQVIEVPTDMNLSLMEVLKASDYPILATCGGMALCATCHVEILEGDDFKQATEAEFDILDTLPFVSDSSRLACQMRLSDAMDGLFVRILGE